MSARVKSVLSGDTLVLTPVDAPPTEENERLLSLAFLSAPRLNSNDLHGFESREFLRNLLIGKPVQFRVLYSANNREYGDVRAPIFDSLIQKVLEGGAAKLRDDAAVKPGWAELGDRLERAQLAAQAAKTGVWAADTKQVRQIGQVPEELYGSGRQVPSVVEKVVAGDRIHLRTLMDKDFHYVGPALVAGVRAPRTAFQDSPAEPYGEAAKLFMVTRMQQRSVRAEFVAPAPSNSALPLVNLVYPAGDVAALMLEQGLGYVADNQAALIGSERLLTLRAAQRKAEQQGVNLWHRAKPKVSATGYEATVVKVVSADTVVVEANGAEKTVQLASVRAPRKSDPAQEPFVAGAREFARKLLIGKDVSVHVDAMRPASEQFEERELVTLGVGTQNAGVEIVAAGWATVVRHRRDDLDKSPFIDDLFAAERAAQEAKRGLFGAAPAASARLVDASETVVRARGYLSSLDRRGRVPAVVEYVHAGGRLKLSVPSENCVLTAVLAGVRVPRPSEPAGDAALEFTTKRFNQRDVQVVVENVDKTGAFISKVYLAGKQVPLQVLLAQQGLADVHEGSANAAGLRDELDAAKESAQAAHLGMWKDYEPAAPVAAEPVAEVEEKTPGGYEDAFCVGATTEAIVYQLAPARERYTKLKADMATFYQAAANTGVKFDKAPRRGEYVAAKIGANYVRGRVTAFERSDITIEQLDLGKQIVVPQAQLRPLQPQFGTAIPPLAVVKPLAYVAVPPRDYISDYVGYLADAIVGKRVVVQSTPAGVVVFTEDSKSANDSINSRLIDDGYSSVVKTASADPIKAHLDDLQQAAMGDRIGMWQYGDPRDDEPL